jgi:ATP-dependent RNA helicase DDX20
LIGTAIEPCSDVDCNFRILHLIKNEVFNISNLRTIVLDESDKLLESGKMAKDVNGILKLTEGKVQIIAATATVSNHMEGVLKQFMRNPVGITPKHEIPVLLGIKQFVHVLPIEPDNIKLMKTKIVELKKIFDRIT